MRVLLDLFCGRFGWSKAFAAREWKCIGVDIVKPPEIPEGCEFLLGDVLEIECVTTPRSSRHPKIRVEAHFGRYTFRPDAIVASPPCQQFSVHGMKHFHPNPKYPTKGIRLFEHTRKLCEAAAVPYVIENVRSAQQFVGYAQHHCGPFYLWGNPPPLLPRGIGKKMSQARERDPKTGKRIYAAATDRMWSTKRKQVVAEIPPELANTVADWFERLLEAKT